MKNHFHRTLAVLLLLAFSIGALPLPARADAPPQPIVGMIVRSRDNIDFPSAPNRSAKTLRAELDTLTDYAVSGGYNAIFFEVRPQGDALYSSKIFPSSRFLVKKQGAFTFFDPLKEMIRAASAKGLAVYALVDPYSLGTDRSLLADSHPAIRNESLRKSVGEHLLLDSASDEVRRLNAEDLARLASEYAVSGILLQNLYFTDGVEKDAARMMQTVKTAIGGRVPLGMLISFDNPLETYADAFPFADLLLPYHHSPVGAGGLSYANQLAEWQKAAGAIPLLPVIDVTADASGDEPCVRAYIAQRAGVSDRVVNGYSALRRDENGQGSLLASFDNPSPTQPIELPYHPAPSLTLTRPTDSIFTQYASYFIMGMSDPTQPLMLNGKTVDRQTSDGVFGAQVPLAMGNNTFTFRQGNRSVTATIRRGGPTAPVAISKVLSAYPISSAVTKNGAALEIRCTAPGGSRVVASIGGVSVTLKPSAAVAASLPTTFIGTLTLSGATDGEIKNLGPISYTLTHNGTTAVFPSGGNVYLLGNGARAQLRVTDHVASVFPDSTVTEGDYKSVYKAGTIEEIADQMGEYYKLASGGYIKKATVEVQKSPAPDRISPAAIRTQHTDRAEQFVLQGAKGLPYAFTDAEDGTVTLTLYGRLTLPAQVDVDSTLFSSIRWSQGDDGSLICVLTPKDRKKVWGVDILHRGEDTVLYAKRAPTLSDDIRKPLSGILVVLDPGHGGRDPGALSVLGAQGPTEKELNLANALMLQHRLEQLGATVTRTRQSNEETRSLYERMEIAEDILPDFFLSMHHNSVAESVNAYQNGGVEAYYYETFGKQTGEAIVRHISNAAFERPFRHVKQDYYTVTRMRYTPSILMEIAFMPNPIEFRYACDTTEIYKTANAIASALLELIRTANA